MLEFVEEHCWKLQTLSQIIMKRHAKSIKLILFRF